MQCYLWYASQTSRMKLTWWNPTEFHVDNNQESSKLSHMVPVRKHNVSYWAEYNVTMNQANRLSDFMCGVLLSFTWTRTKNRAKWTKQIVSQTSRVELYWVLCGREPNTKKMVSHTSHGIIPLSFVWSRNNVQETNCLTYFTRYNSTEFLVIESQNQENRLKYFTWEISTKLHEVKNQKNRANCLT